MSETGRYESDTSKRVITYESTPIKGSALRRTDTEREEKNRKFYCTQSSPSHDHDTLSHCQ